MRAPLEVEKAIEREKITAYVVSHLPIVKAYAVKMGLVDIINQLRFLVRDALKFLSFFLFFGRAERP